jgi:PAS domain S-box-containing protein
LLEIAGKMEQTTTDPYTTLTRTLSTGQGKSDCKEMSQQLKSTDQAPDESIKRYEHLVHAAKVFIFTVIVKDGHAVCTIHYPGVFLVTGYTEEEYAAQPQLWCNMIYDEDKEIVLRQIAQLLRGEAPPPIKHRIIHKNGSICWLRNTSVPVFDPQGKLIAYDGLVVDISKIEFAQEEQERLIAELTSALAMVKTLHSLLPVCCSCKKIRDDKGYWEQIDAYISGHFSNIEFTHGFCPDCAKRLYPRYYEEKPETTLISKLVTDIQKETGVLIDKAIDTTLAKNQTFITAVRNLAAPAGTSLD